MKTYYKDNDELARDWVNGNLDPAKGAHTDRDRMVVYSGEPNAIYSYGKHFTIALKFTASDTGRNFILFTQREYSPTTSKHKRAVRSAASWRNLVYLPSLDYSYDYKMPVTEQDLAEQVLASGVAKLEEFTKTCLAKRPHKTHPEKFLELLRYVHASLVPFNSVTLPDFTESFDAIKAHCRVQIAKARLITA